MHSQWGLMLQIQAGCKPICIKTEDFGIAPQNRPHFSLPNEEETVRLFLDAVRSGDDPKSYLSRGFAESVDLREIRSYFGPLSCYTRLKRPETMALPGKSRKVNSILVMDENTIIHLHMRWEPGVGSWKIYGIEKE